jgi:hypothetical protein
MKHKPYYGANMSDVETLQEFARFRAAEVGTFGSATDICDFQGAVIAAEGSTDPLVARQLFELQLLPFAMKLSASEREQDATFHSDFAVLDELRIPEERIRRQISAVRKGSRLLYRERLARRLVLLLSALEEEDEPWEESSPESLRHMLLFLETLPDFRCPTITITPSATFRAQWSPDSTRHFAVDFVPDGQVRFVVFSPDPRHPDRVQRVSGIASWENVMKAVEPYRVHRWAADAGT